MKKEQKVSLSSKEEIEEIISKISTNVSDQSIDLVNDLKKIDINNISYDQAA